MFRFLHVLPLLLLAFAFLLTPTSGQAEMVDSAYVNHPPCHSDQTTETADKDCTHKAGCANACCAFLCLLAPTAPAIPLQASPLAPRVMLQAVLIMSADIFEPPRAA